MRMKRACCAPPHPLTPCAPCPACRPLAAGGCWGGRRCCHACAKRGVGWGGSGWARALRERQVCAALATLAPPKLHFSTTHPPSQHAREHHPPSLPATRHSLGRWLRAHGLLDLAASHPLGGRRRAGLAIPASARGGGWGGVAGGEGECVGVAEGRPGAGGGRAPPFPPPPHQPPPHQASQPATHPSPDHARHRQGHAPKLAGCDCVPQEGPPPQQHQHSLGVAEHLHRGVGAEGGWGRWGRRCVCRMRTVPRAPPRLLPGPATPPPLSPPPSHTHLE